ncbi:MAG: translation elongation factor Ts [Planctomycetota bacterium]
MAEISAVDVKKLRERTGLPLMDCKSALTEANGDMDLAIEVLRKKGNQLLNKRADRETAFGRFGIYSGSGKSAGAIVELKCESAPVAGNEEFVQLANDLAQALAHTPSVQNAEQLLDCPSPSKKGVTLREQKDELFNRIREVFNVGRIQRLEGGTGGYSHNSGTVAGVLLGIDGGADDVAKDVCMHIAAMRPRALTKEELDPTLIAKEREILREAALKEGKPESIVDKMVDGRLRNFFAESVLLEQPFVKDDKQTVGQFAKSKGMNIKQYVHWVLGELN